MLLCVHLRFCVLLFMFSIKGFVLGECDRYFLKSLGGLKYELACVNPILTKHWHMFLFDYAWSETVLPLGWL